MESVHLGAVVVVFGVKFDWGRCCVRAGYTLRGGEHEMGSGSVGEGKGEMVGGMEENR